MKGKVLALSALALVGLAGCGFWFTVVGSGELVDTPYGLTGFTRITAEDAARVTIIPDAAYSVTVTCDDNIVSCLDVRQDGQTLSLDLIDGLQYAYVTFRVEVHMPEISSLSLSGAARATVQSGFSSKSDFGLSASGAATAQILGLHCAGLIVDLSGASGLTAPDLEASSLAATLEGASTLTAAGSAPSLDLTAAGASSADLLGVPAETAEVDLSGASTAWVDAASIRVSASGVSVLHYAGSAVLDVVELSGASEVVPAS